MYDLCDLLYSYKFCRFRTSFPLLIVSLRRIESFVLFYHEPPLAYSIYPLYSIDSMDSTACDKILNMSMCQGRHFKYLPLKLCHRNCVCKSFQHNFKYVNTFCASFDERMMHFDNVSLSRDIEENRLPKELLLVSSIF